MGATNFLESAVLTWILSNYTVYVGYGTADPTETGASAAEPSGGTGFARQAFEPATVTNSGNDYWAENDNIITFPTVTSSQGTITWIYFWDASTAGNLLAHESLANLGLSNINAVTGTIIKFLAQDLRLTAD